MEHLHAPWLSKQCNMFKEDSGKIDAYLYNDMHRIVGRGDQDFKFPFLSLFLQTKAEFRSVNHNLNPEFPPPNLESLIQCQRLNT